MEDWLVPLGTPLCRIRPFPSPKNRIIFRKGRTKTGLENALGNTLTNGQEIPIRPQRWPPHSIARISTDAPSIPSPSARTVIRPGSPVDCTVTWARPLNTRR